MERKKLTGQMDMSSSLRARLLDKNGKEILDTKKVGPVEKRVSRKAGKAIQIVYKDDKIVHLHCKDSNCGNEWKIKENTDWTSKFEVTGTEIKCLKCGRVHKSG